MPFAGINWLAVLVASLASFVIGFAWFSPKTFFPVWWKAMGRGTTRLRPAASRWVPSSV